MHKIFPLLLFTIFNLAVVSCAETEAKDPGSVSPSANHLTQTEKLSATAKVWGFLKYYHPEVAKGKIDWDNQLFKILKELEKVETKEQLSETFITWIDSLGKIEKCTACRVSSSDEMFEKNFDLSWKDPALFTAELREKLRFIEKNRVQGDQYYITQVGNVGNIQLQNERTYDNFNWEKRELRLLTLFRYWNIVEYFYPYKYQMDQLWDETLFEMVPKFENPATEQEYHLAMLELVVHLDDSHGGFMSKQVDEFFGKKFIPARFRIIDGQAVIFSFYNDSIGKKDGWQIGDAVIEVEGVPVMQRYSEMEKYIPGSNRPTKMRNAYHTIFNGSTDSVTVKFSRDGIVKESTFPRYEFKKFNYTGSKNEEKWKLLENNIGYVHMGVLEKEDVRVVMEQLKDTRGIILDIRNYPKGTMYLIADKLTRGSRDFVKFLIPNLNYPGKFNWTKPLQAGAADSSSLYKGKVVLLVDERTQSHAEFTAMALQTADNVTTIGSQTAGADGNVSDVTLVGGHQTYITGIGVFYPDGRETQRIGIVPDIEVLPTLKGIKEGRDEVLEKALQVLKE